MPEAIGSPYDGQVGSGGDGRCEVSGEPASADYDFEASLSGGSGVLTDIFGTAMRRDDFELVLHAVFFQVGGAFFEYGEVGVASGQDTHDRGQSSSISIASSAMSVRYCIPGKCISSTAA